MGKFQSTKLIDGFSTCFRQWKAQDTHCKFLHGYSIYFHVTFEGELDCRNWVMDYGFLKRSKTKIRSVDNVSGLDPNHNWYDFNVGEWFKYMFDHTVVIAEDDPEKETFRELYHKHLIQLRIVENVGSEMFAKFVYDELNKFLYKETNDRVRVVRVECFEHARNSAIYMQGIN